MSEQLLIDGSPRVIKKWKFDFYNNAPRLMQKSVQSTRSRSNEGYEGIPSRLVKLNTVSSIL